MTNMLVSLKKFATLEKLNKALNDTQEIVSSHVKYIDKVSTDIKYTSNIRQD